MASPNPDRERLKTFFTVPDAAVPRRWDDLWIEGTFLPFDRLRPNPALEEALKKTLRLTDVSFAAQVLGSPLKSDKAGRKRALVPGCGRGYDVLLLAAYGYDAVGLEISETAVKACEVLRDQVESGLAGNEVEGLDKDVLDLYQTKDDHIGRGTASFVAGDFFSDDWMAEGGTQQSSHKWDLVYDYTFLSALPVSMRPKWAGRMRDLVDPAGGRLLCVEFPTYKEPNTGGPPWALPSKVYMAHLGKPGAHIEYDADSRVVINAEDEAKVEKGEAIADDGMLRIAHWKAEKTHEIGKGTDHIAIWKLVTGS